MKRNEYLTTIKLCHYGHHKIRQNKYGISWCTRCGLLINSSNTYVSLEDKDKLIIKTE